MKQQVGQKVGALIFGQDFGMAIVPIKCIVNYFVMLIQTERKRRNQDEEEERILTYSMRIRRFKLMEILVEQPLLPKCWFSPTKMKLDLLPALPDAWESGSVNGICARGGFEIAMEWNGKTLKKVTIFSKKGGKTNLISGVKNKEITLKKGQKMEIIW